MPVLRLRPCPNLEEPRPLGCETVTGQVVRLIGGAKQRDLPLDGIDRRVADHHRATETWLGRPVETLEDLLRPGLRAVCIDINPSPVSVAAGHYYQGKAGQRCFSRLRSAGALGSGEGFEDDLAFAAGIGFTDIDKRPTARASEVSAEEFRHGKQALAEKLALFRPALAIFTFKKTAEVLLGKFAGNGFVPDLRLDGIEVFVMPDPYEAAETAEPTMRTLAEWWQRKA